jgi:ring-1,2-phenylacetyl-CoA epoxidase subunit PaaE
MADHSFSIEKVTVTRIIRETADAKTFILEMPEGRNLSYKAGQFLTLVFNTAHGEKRRSYSISSSPELNEPLSITVKKVDNGEFSRKLLSETIPGDFLLTAGIGGLFTLPGKPDAGGLVFFFAAGSGITPIYSMLKTLLYTRTEQAVLIYSNKSKSDAIFLQQLKELEIRFPDRLKVQYLFSDIPDVYQSRLSNWLLNQWLDEYKADQLVKAQYFLCGPFDYMRMIEITLRSRIPAASIHKEQFNTLPRMLLPTPPDTLAHQVTIRLNGIIHTLEVQYPQSILAVAKSKKLNLPYSCEAGRCGSCVATCTSGKIWMAYNEVLMEDELIKGRVLLCQGFPVGGDADILID